MHVQNLAVVMPAYNEADGLADFLTEVRDAVAPLAEHVTLVVVDDRSTDDTALVLDDLRRSIPELVPVTAEKNRGHGPSALAAYRRGLEADPDVIVHVDGDGQFVGKDFPAVISALENSDVVHGVRTGREEPWFRVALTRMVGAGVAVVARHRVPDVNTPLRAYRPAALRRLLAVVPVEALVPHVHFSLAERRLGLKVVYVPVRSIHRRGLSDTGTMWGAKQSRRLPPKRLLGFAGRAAVEVWRCSLSPRRRRAIRAAAGAQGAVAPCAEAGAPTASGSSTSGSSASGSSAPESNASQATVPGPAAPGQADPGSSTSGQAASESSVSQPPARSTPPTDTHPDDT